MSSTSTLRLLLALAVLVLLLLGLLLGLQLLESALTVRQHLENLSPWLPYLFLGGLALLLLVAGWWLRTLVRPPPREKRPLATPRPKMNEAEVHERLARNQAAGAEVEEARRELAELHARRAGGEFHVAVAGEINAGKSALVAALIPDACVRSDPIGGSTREVIRQVWITPGGDRIILADLPGLGEAGGALDEAARAEALRAHVVLFLCDGDLNRGQWAALRGLAELEKPLILALNKVDRYNDGELTQLHTRLRERLDALPGGGKIPLVKTRAGGARVVIRRLPDGREVEETQSRPPEVGEVRRALQRVIDGDRTLLETLRDGAVFALAVRQLDAALGEQRRARAEALIQQHARRAMVAAMAAITPGMDLIFQGVVGLNLLRELCALHGVSLTGLSPEGVLQRIAGEGARTLPLVLAVAGNALKAFPGLGTLAGGALHAVAYGLLVQALGRAAQITLAERGELAEGPLLAHFQERMGEDVEKRAVEMARWLLTHKGEGP